MCETAAERRRLRNRCCLPRRSAFEAGRRRLRLLLLGRSSCDNWQRYHTVLARIGFQGGVEGVGEMSRGDGVVWIVY